MYTVEVIEDSADGADEAPGQNVVVISIVSVVFLPSGQLVTVGGQEVMV